MFCATSPHKTKGKCLNNSTPSLKHAARDRRAVSTALPLSARQYYALYVELLGATENAQTLQGLLRRPKGAKETRDEMVWVQGRVLG